ncbi:MAG: ribosome recycling factor [Candidatus Magasanikbacteria bacterium CG11_big_fil_rev_8_21_14_0_20_39_34]|uniref:Ribosome-recycling factor n=1 Tax=Candidatus Magasanikbacteria bacterium CG11_big_fil_rev_8_21_14_0_20_39_34 TaxID=1974653 RepID=A0A2H0N6B5_9BACT|nr:MAG: ribosome recycling factor [Candidatus Magasanikbacteria bacterium CG11_big_fil_rev_8_21_14_0_20_39_34]
MLTIHSYKEEFDKSITFLRQDISTLRTGRATPALVEDIPVVAYGTKQPLKAVASISVADAKTINVEPWDKSLINDIDKSIREGNLGFNPVNDGKLIRIPLPELNSERRAELIKVLHNKLESARISIRKIREEVKKQVDAAFKNKEVAEDEKFQMEDDLEKLVKEYNMQIKEIGEKKEVEINTV